LQIDGQKFCGMSFDTRIVGYNKTETTCNFKKPP